MLIVCVAIWSDMSVVCAISKVEEAPLSVSEIRRYAATECVVLHIPATKSSICKSCDWLNGETWWDEFGLMWGWARSWHGRNIVKSVLEWSWDSTGQRPCTTSGHPSNSFQLGTQTQAAKSNIESWQRPSRNKWTWANHVIPDPPSFTSAAHLAPWTNHHGCTMLLRSLPRGRVARSCPGTLAWHFRRSLFRLFFGFYDDFLDFFTHTHKPRNSMPPSIGRSQRRDTRNLFLCWFFFVIKGLSLWAKDKRLFFRHFCQSEISTFASSPGGLVHQWWRSQFRLRCRRWAWNCRWLQKLRVQLFVARNSVSQSFLKLFFI